MQRLLALLLGASVATSILTLAAATAASAKAPIGTNVVFHTLAQYRAGVLVPNPQNLYFNGGPDGVQLKTQVYIAWWGPQWATGFASGGYTSAQAQKYTTDFFRGVGGSTWIATDMQYCGNVPLATFDCTGIAGAQYITNPKNQLKGTWTDTRPVPAVLTDDVIAQEALRVSSHFGYNINATYLIYTPTGHSEPGFNTVWCAWHNATKDARGNIVAFGYIPYQPDAGQNCGMNFVNASNDSYGHGYFDGFSIVAGHEYEEAQTDTNGGYGWTDATGQENADKCAWDSRSANITLGRQFYAVQPIWSNKIGDCTMQ